MFISKKDIIKLEKIAISNPNGIARILIHDQSSEKVQLMCIAFAKGKRYSPIADKCDGWITFLVLKGSLTIKTYDLKNNEKISSNKLLVNEFLKIPRNVFRETIGAKDQVSIFVEIIEGGFDKSKRLSMKSVI